MPLAPYCIWPLGGWVCQELSLLGISALLQSNCHIHIQEWWLGWLVLCNSMQYRWITFEQDDDWRRLLVFVWIPCHVGAIVLLSGYDGVLSWSHSMHGAMCTQTQAQVIMFGFSSHFVSISMPNSASANGFSSSRKQLYPSAASIMPARAKFCTYSYSAISRVSSWIRGVVKQTNSSGTWVPEGPTLPNKSPVDT